MVWTAEEARPAGFASSACTYAGSCAGSCGEAGAEIAIVCALFGAAAAYSTTCRPIHPVSLMAQPN